MPTVKRDVSDEIGFHYELDLEDGYHGAVEVDAFRVHSQGEVFLEVRGLRATDGAVDTVVVTVPLNAVGSLAQALVAADRFLRKNGTLK